MAETEREPKNNSLEDVAAAASDTLHGQTVSVTGSATRRINAGQVKMHSFLGGQNPSARGEYGKFGGSVGQCWVA